MALQFTAQNFEQEVLNSSEPVLVDFWAPWCAPCRALGPVIEQVAIDTHGTAKVGKINVDEDADLGAKYGVTSIPTVLIFKDGDVVDTIVGVRPRQHYVDALNSLSVGT